MVQCLTGHHSRLHGLNVEDGEMFNPLCVANSIGGDVPLLHSQPPSHPPTLLVLTAIGGEIRGQTGARTPFIFQTCILFSMPYTMKRSLKTVKKIGRLRTHSASQKFLGNMPPDLPC